nr:MAG TPA: hypothetical protein [Caudoviricetes sp.]
MNNFLICLCTNQMIYVIIILGNTNSKPLRYRKLIRLK